MTPDLEVTVTIPGDLVDALRNSGASAEWYDDLAASTGEVQSIRARGLLAAAVKRAPRPIQVGDRVRYREDKAPLEVAAVDGEDAWCRYPDGEHSTFRLIALSRVEDDQ